MDDTKWSLDAQVYAETVCHDVVLDDMAYCGVKDLDVVTSDRVVESERCSNRSVQHEPFSNASSNPLTHILCSTARSSMNLTEWPDYAAHSPTFSPREPFPQDLSFSVLGDAQKGAMFEKRAPQWPAGKPLLSDVMSADLPSGPTKEFNRFLKA